jgi:uncharacterized protein (TIGR03437 family)
MVGQIGGPTQAVAVQGNYAYVGVGLRLVVLDVSNPAAMREVGATAPFPHFVEGVAVSGKLACVAAGGAGLRVVDISDPTRPTELGAFDTRGYSEGIAVAGTMAYLADGPYGLRIFDVSNPKSPKEVSSAFVTNYAFEVAVSGRYAYIAAAGAGLLVADVSTPARPVEVSALDTPGYAYGVAASGTTVYIADGWEGFRIINAADPARPVQIGFYKTPGWAFGVAVSGGLLYVADAFKGLRVLDATRLTELGSYEVVGGHAGSVAVVGGFAFVADRNWGVHAVSVSDPARLARVGFYCPLGFADAVAVAGNYAYVAAGVYGLRVVDISDPVRPREVGAYDTQSYASSVAATGQYAYVATTNPPDVAGGLHVVDIRDPGRPTRTGFHPERTGTYRDLAVVRGVAYLATEYGLELVGLSNPQAPKQLAFIELIEWQGGVPRCVVGVAVTGGFAYLAVEGAGLKVVDVSQPAKPILAAECRWPNADANDVDVTNGFAYVAELSGLTAVDISNPRQPTRVGFYQTSDLAESVTMAGSRAFVANGAAGLAAVDTSSPASLTVAGSHNTPGYAQEVAVQGDYVYVADQDGGLLILRTLPVGVMPQSRGPWDKLQLVSGGIRKASGQAESLSYPGAQAVARETEALPVGGGGDSGAATWSDEAGVRLGVSEEGSVAVVPPRFHAARSAPQQTVSSTGEAATRFDSGSPSSRSSSSAVPAGADCTVNNAADSGLSTLRWCLEKAGAGATITFDPSVFPPARPATITLVNPLPLLNQGRVTIDASNAGVILDGSRTPSDTGGLEIHSNDNLIKGLQIVRFPSRGVGIHQGAKRNVIGGDRSRGSGPLGEGNLLSGNGQGGVLIAGEGAEDNVVSGNLIGTDLSGTVSVGNGWYGVGVGGNGAQRNRIGGRTPGERNIISGNRGDGVSLGSLAAFNLVIGNYIGTDSTGTVALGNEGYGVFIVTAHNNRIGGSSAEERNVISANGKHGVGFTVLASGNIIIGNYIGVDASGAKVLGNGDHGIALEKGANNNLIKNNVVVATGRNCVLICDWNSSYNAVTGNLLGTDATGTKALGGTIHAAVGVGMGAAFNRIGGTAPGDRNVIVGGVNFGRQGAIGNLVLGNFMGTDITGVNPVTRMHHGVNLGGGSRRPFIGGTTEAERNVISGNPNGGINVETSVDYVFVGGNYIGTDASGRRALSNQGAGIFIRGERNITQNNTIAYNSGVGLTVAGSSHNTIRRNSIHSHSRRGIELADAGNSMLSAPVLSAVTATGVSGTACPGCEVEIFSDEEDEGWIFEGSTVAAASGAFAFQKGSALTGPNITATATDAEGNTSEFSRPRKMVQTAGPLVNVSAASYAGDPLATESIVTAFGSNLATTTESAATLPLPTVLAGTTVQVLDSASVVRSAPLYFVSPAQVNYQMPPGTALGLATVTITNAGGVTYAASLEMVSVAPGLFSASGTGQGLAAANVLRVEADGSQTYEPATQPIDLGPETDQVYLLLYGTGIRRRSSLEAVRVRIGGTELPVSYAGPQPEYPGLDQVNVLLPRNLRGRGEVNVVLTVEGKAANTVRVSFR